MQREKNVEYGLPVASRVGFSGNFSKRPLLICFSHLRWNFVWQRPQHVLGRAAQDFDVVFFEEPVCDGSGAPTLRVSETDGIKVAVPILPADTTEEEAVSLQRGLLDAFLQKRPDPSVLWYYTPMAVSFSSHVTADVIVYDNMDELSAFRGASPEMLANEDDLFARADLVFTGGVSLYEAKRHRHPRVHAFPSSIDAAHFAASRERRGQDPADQAPIKGPRLGFFGVIDERFDAELLDGMARLRPDWQFVVLGPVAKIDPETLPRSTNIHYLGQKSYAELPAYLSGWDLGIMPFAINEATRFISPTKTPEFLAAGVPVISTAIRDVIRPYGDKRLVEIAETPPEFIASAERLLTMPRAPWLARVDRHLADGSWDKTWAAMRRLIASRSGEPASASVGAGSAPVSLVPAE
ncbi:MAG: glycosyltransferase family 1 protein [Enterovirga sp.]|nr:glycosyltransferase family 1 protein [Enterovirga sp.]